MEEAARCLCRVEAARLAGQRAAQAMILGGRTELARRLLGAGRHGDVARLCSFQ
jgi:hypothetical protein